MSLFNRWHSRSWKAVNPRYFLACIDYFRDEGPKKAGYSLRDKVVEVTLTPFIYVEPGYFAGPQLAALHPSWM